MTRRPGLDRRRFLTGATAALAGLATIAAGSPPAGLGPIQLLVGAPPGVGTDLGARIFAPFLERHLPQAQLQIVNQPGEAGFAAYRALAAAPPDPPTLGWVAGTSLVARSIDHDDPGLLPGLTLLGAVQEEPLVLVVPAGSPFESVASLLRGAADALPFGTPPAGSAPHLGALQLQAAAGVALNIVPFPSVAAVRQASADGNVAASLLELGDALVALRDGRLAALGVTAAGRVAALPDVPSLTEAGPPLVATILRGLAGPPDLAPARAAALRDALQAVIADPEYKAQGDDSGFTLIWLDGADWRQRLAAEQAALLSLWRATPWLPGRAG